MRSTSWTNQATWGIPATTREGNVKTKLKETGQEDVKLEFSWLSWYSDGLLWKRLWTSWFQVARSLMTVSATISFPRILFHVVNTEDEVWVFSLCKFGEVRRSWILVVSHTSYVNFFQCANVAWFTARVAARAICGAHKYNLKRFINSQHEIERANLLCPSWLCIFHT
jgi:hypothetical protein